LDDSKKREGGPPPEKGKSQEEGFTLSGNRLERWSGKNRKKWERSEKSGANPSLLGLDLLGGWEF